MNRRTPAARIASTSARVPSVLTTRKVRAAARVARDGHEVDDGIDAGERAPAGSPGRVTSPIRTSTVACAAGRRATTTARRVASRARQRDDTVAGIEQGGHEVAADEAVGAGDEDA